MTHVTLKYVRHSVAGFIVWPKQLEGLAHKDVGRALSFSRDVAHGHLLSAGFIEFDPGSHKPFCYGRSESLDLDSKAEDTAALRAEWGMDAPVKPSAAALEAAKAFSAALPDLPTSTQEGV